MTWHATPADLRDYASGTLPAPRLWSIDTHLAACAPCRTALAATADPAVTDAGWARLDAELDAPRPGAVESLLVRCGTPDHTARLLTATPVMRRSWLAAVALTLLLAAVVGRTGTPLLLLATAPLLPLAGVAVSFGPRIDPLYETALVAPVHTFRLLMIRSVAVLLTTLPAALAASLTMPSAALLMAGWLPPALALTSLGLVLTPRLGPVAAPATVGAGWLAALLAGRLLTDGAPFPLTAAGQLTGVAAALAAAAALVAARDRFDGTSRPAPYLRPRAGRLP
ncbi:zf-HC2 domain-containing protein [Streptomyces avicenniae]|uniref:zf-HC2 domain-containing protein n=1 Tax=Streptomyces avicenniae TaxID=500153 RepID=UPI00069A9EB5|nr:zf-HC2 domain-containing protein [Streptomyces avicenniae]